MGGRQIRNTLLDRIDEKPHDLHDLPLTQPGEKLTREPNGFRAAVVSQLVNGDALARIGKGI
jgi:hypothetical protein